MKLLLPVLALPLVLSFGRRSEPTESSPQPPPTFVEEMSYFVEESGTWCAPNPAYAPGNGQPEVYTYEFAWDLRQRIVTLDIGGVYDDGRVRLFWFYVYSWHPLDRIVLLHGYAPDGTIIDGWSENFANGRSDTFLHGIHRFTGEFDLKDSVRILGEDLFESVSYQRTATGYQEQQRLIWKREALPEVAERTEQQTAAGAGIK